MVILTAFQNTINSDLKKTNQTDCSVTCKDEINQQAIIFFAFYNSRKEDFGKPLAALPKKKTILSFGDINFPETNSNGFTSKEDDEQTVL